MRYVIAAGDPFGRVVGDVYPAYQAALREQNAFDFDDLLVKPVELFRANEDILFAYRRRFRSCSSMSTRTRTTRSMYSCHCWLAAPRAAT
jgi:hypothetical protein